MKRVEANVFAENFKEKDAKSLDDYQQRRVPELKDDQIGRAWSFSTEDDLNSFKRLLSQWASADNLSSFVLSDETGITTLGGKLFGGMMYAATDGTIDSDQTYATPAHNSTFQTKDGVFTAEVSYEGTTIGEDKVVDMVIALIESGTKEWRIVFEAVATIGNDEDIEAGTNVTITSKLSGTAYLDDVEVGTVDFIPIYGEAICDVPERYNIQSIETPQVDNEDVPDGPYRSSGIFSIKRRRVGGGASDKQFFVIQIIRKGYLTSGDYSKTGTSWEIRNGNEFKSGNGQPVLMLRNLDPDMARSIASDISSGTTTYTNEIYTTTDGLLEGTWYSLRAEYLIEEEDGSGTVLWFLSNHNNDDFWFNYRPDSQSTAIDFYKINATSTSKKDFIDNYYFAPDMNWYYSEDGVKYSAKNGVDVDPELWLPNDAKTVAEYVDGRIITVQEQYRPETDDWILFVRIVWGTEDKVAITIVQSDYFQKRTEINAVLSTRQDLVDMLNQSYFDTSGNWYLSDDAINYQYLNYVAVTPATLASVGATSLSTAVEGRSARAIESFNERSGKWNLQIIITHDSSDSRMSTALGGTSCTYAATPDSTSTIESGYNVTNAELLTVIAAYASCAEGTVQKFQYEPVGSGRYNFTAIKTATTGLATEFVLGGTTYYFGFHYKKKPTTDASLGWWALVGSFYENTTHILLGGYDAGGGTIASSVDDTFNITPSIVREDDGTWSWNIRTSTMDEENFGNVDPEDTGEYLFAYGYDEDEWRWKGRVAYTDLTATDKIDFKGRYLTVPAGEFGNHDALTGRRVLLRELRNPEIDGKKVSYDVYERILTAEIEDDDEWYLVAATEGLDRYKKQLHSETTQNEANDFAALGTPPIANYEYVSAHYPVFWLHENCVMRRKIIFTMRKFFVRRPKESDLASSGIKDEMDAIMEISGKANPHIAITFNITQVAQFKFAVEKAVVMTNPKYEVDEDAFTRLTVDGASMCRRSFVATDGITNIDE